VLKFLDGYKTYIAGIGVICTGIAMIATALTPDAMSQIDPQKIYEGLVMVGGGLAAIGLGHKLDKVGTKAEVTPPA